MARARRKGSNSELKPKGPASAQTPPAQTSTTAEASRSMLQSYLTRFGFPFEGEPMFAHHQYQAARSRINAGLDNAYERLAETNDYKKNENNLRLIQICVVTVSAIATGFVNAF